MNPARIGLIGGLSDEKFSSKFLALVSNDKVERTYLFRRNGNPFPHDVRIHELRISEALKKYKLVFDFFNIIRLYFLCISKKIDLLIGVYFFPYGIYALMIGRFTMLPVILVFTGTDMNRIMRNRFYIKILRRANKIAVRGPISREELITAGIPEDKVFILPNYFNFPFYYKAINNGVREYDLIFIGYIRKLKRLDILLEVISKLKLNGLPNLKCLVVGDGKEKASIIETSIRLKVNENIIFQNHTEDIRPLLNNSKLLVLTSEAEGLPMVLIESMSMGVPVIAPEINDIPSIVQNGYNGFCVSFNDIKGYVEKINFLLNNQNDWIRISKNAISWTKDKYEKEYSLDSISNLWSDVIVSF